MITHDDIISLGFIYMETWSGDGISSYIYTENRRDKPKGTQNVYRLSRIDDTDYFNLVSDLERLPEFTMWTRGYNGEIEDISELFYIFDSFKTANRKI